ncbi:MFS transporter [Nocardia sp. NPDC003963]
MPGLGDRIWWALAAVMLAVLAVGLDGTVLSVALPTLSTSLQASESDLQWFSSGYLLVLAAGMLPAGVVGDRFGHRRTMLVALVLFGLGSVACAYSTTPGQFIAARVLMGIAGAGIIVMALASITILFTRQQRPRAVGIWAAANFLALPNRPDPRRLATHPLLVGLGVPDQCAGRADRPDRDRPAHTRIPGAAGSGSGPGGHGVLGRRPRGADLRVDRGR